LAFESLPAAKVGGTKSLVPFHCVKDEQLSGIVEADDTYFLYSEKGSRHLDRPFRKRGGKAKSPA